MASEARRGLFPELELIWNSVHHAHFWNGDEAWDTGFCWLTLIAPAWSMTRQQSVLPATSTSNDSALEVRNRKERSVVLWASCIGRLSHPDPKKEAETKGIHVDIVLNTINLYLSVEMNAK